MNAPALAPASPAGFWKRYVAYTVDILVIWAAIEVLARLFFPTLASDEGESLRTLMVVQDPEAGLQAQTAMAMQALHLLARLVLLTSLAYVVVGGLYFALCESSSWQATPGKRLVGIKVTDSGGARLRRGHAFARFLAAGLSWATLNIGHALAAWTPDRRALHDIVAGTRVVDADPARPQMPFWGWLVVAASALAFIALIVATAWGTWATMTAASNA